MSLTYKEALEHLQSWTKTDSLVKHARAVEVVMRKAAYKYGKGKEDEEIWGITGLLHDADYEEWPEEHPKKIMAWLSERGEHLMAHAISCHYTQWNATYENRLDQSLLACDELTGFVMACCLVRPGGISTLEPSSVRKKLKDKAFAAKVDRHEIQVGIEMLKSDPIEHIQLVIDSLKPLSQELGLEGKPIS